jgi:hypothetical protein
MRRILGLSLCVAVLAVASVKFPAFPQWRPIEENR